MQPKLLKVKTIIFLKMEDDLNFFEKGRRPQFFLNGRRPQKNNQPKTIKSKNNSCGTAPGNLLLPYLSVSVLVRNSLIDC